MTKHDRPDGPPYGLREKKRRETLRRITDTGICLFIEKGYDATTIDEIAAAAKFLALEAPASMTGSVIDVNGASYVR